MIGRREENSEEEVHEQLLLKSEISLVIQHYNDIFSSFDPRPYSEKALSDDFLQEVKRATRDKGGVYELRFLLPREQRNFEHEQMIKKRLKEHFKRHHRMLLQEIRSTERQGILMAFFGVLAIFISSSLALNEHGWLLRFIEILLEPAGWFTAWTGLDQFYYTVQEKRPDKEFYRKMSDAQIHFSTY